MAEDQPNRRHHDIGGLPADAVPQDEHELDLWEKRVDALMVVLGTSAPGGKRLITVDEIRRGIEDLPPEAYDTLSYYERWVLSLRTILIERGAFTAEELDAKIAEIGARPLAPA